MVIGKEFTCSPIQKPEYYAISLAPIEAESPVTVLCNSLVPDLQRIAGYAEVEGSKMVVAPHHSSNP